MVVDYGVCMGKEKKRDVDERRRRSGGRRDEEK
jgi:hypothetical protein